MCLMVKLKKILSIFTFLIVMLIYCLLVMVFLSKINFNHWLLELLAYAVLGIIWVFPSMYILRPFKRNNNEK